VRLDDPMRSKHLKRALEQLAEEGVTRLFRPLAGGDFIVGVVGPLQLDVLAQRLKSEYELGVRLEPAPFETARWVDGEALELRRFRDTVPSTLAEDRDGAPVFLARNRWDLERTQKDWPKLGFKATREEV
jgi:peptide chain release factor 3